MSHINILLLWSRELLKWNPMSLSKFSLLLCLAALSTSTGSYADNPSPAVSRFEKLEQRSINKSLLQAIQLRNKNQYALAIRNLDSFISSNNRIPQALFERGVCYYHLAQYKNAANDFNKAIDLDPKYLDAYAWLLKTEQQRRWRYDGNKNDQTGLKKVLSRLNQELSILPDSPELLLAQIRAYQSINDPTQALILANKALKIHPDNFAIEHENAVCLSKQGDKQRKQALALLSKRIQSNPADADAYDLRAIINSENKDLAASEYDFQKALSLAPLRQDIRNDAAWFEYAKLKNPDKSLKLLQSVQTHSLDDMAIATLRLRATVKEAQKDFRGAIVDLNQLIVLLKNPEYIMARARCFSKDNQWQAAINDVKNYLLLVPDDSAAYYFEYQNWDTLKQPKEALESINKAIALNRTSKKFLNERAELYFRAGERSKAINDLRQVLKFDQQDSAVLYRLGVFLRENRQFVEAMICFNKALKLNPELKSIYADRGLTYMLMGNWTAAAQDFRQCLRYYPENETYNIYLARTLWNMKQNKEALAFNTKVLQLNPKRIDARIMQIRILYALKENARADAELEKLKTDKNFDSAYLGNRAEFYYSLGLTDLAIADCKSAIKHGIPASRNMLIDILCEDKQYAPALEQAKLLCKDKPRDSDALARLGYLYRKFHQHRKSLECLNQAIAINPDNMNAYFWRTETYIELEDGKHALADANRVIRLSPNAAAGYTLRAEIYRYLLNESSLAIKDRAKALTLKQK